MPVQNGPHEHRINSNHLVIIVVCLIVIMVLILVVVSLIYKIKVGKIKTRHQQQQNLTSQSFRSLSISHLGSYYPTNESVATGNKNFLICGRIFKITFHK